MSEGRTYLEDHPVIELLSDVRSVSFSIQPRMGHLEQLFAGVEMKQHRGAVYDASRGNCVLDTLEIPSIRSPFLRWLIPPETYEVRFGVEDWQEKNRELRRQKIQRADDDTIVDFSMYIRRPVRLFPVVSRHTFSVGTGKDIHWGRVERTPFQGVIRVFDEKETLLYYIVRGVTPLGYILQMPIFSCVGGVCGQFPLPESVDAGPTNGISQAWSIVTGEAPHDVVGSIVYRPDVEMFDTCLDPDWMVSITFPSCPASHKALLLAAPYLFR